MQTGIIITEHEAFTEQYEKEGQIYSIEAIPIGEWLLYVLG